MLKPKTFGLWANTDKDIFWNILPKIIEWAKRKQNRFCAEHKCHTSIDTLSPIVYMYCLYLLFKNINALFVSKPLLMYRMSFEVSSACLPISLHSVGKEAPVRTHSVAGLELVLRMCCISQVHYCQRQALENTENQYHHDWPRWLAESSGHLSQGRLNWCL